VFESKVAGDTVPKEYILGVEKGLRAAAEDGIVAGVPMIDFKAELFDGAYHAVDSSVLAFEIAARAAFKEGAAKAAPRILEPIMRVEVVTPDVYMGDVVGDLNSRRGLITGMDSRDDARVIEAMVPLANMFGYPGTLRSIGRGQAEFTMRFERYALVPLSLDDDDPPPAVAMRG
jgi:elongation factor G